MIKVEAQTLRDRAYRAILADILSQRVLPGDLINRRQVAADLRMSTAPVLEAMVQLQGEGFLEVLPRKGTRVRIVRPPDVQGQLVLREAVECQGARMYCGKPVRLQQTRLRALARTIEHGRLDRPAQWRAEIAFHRALIELADCPALLDAFDKVTTLGLFFLVNQVVSDPNGQVRSSHVSLLRALQTAEPNRAEAAMREHLRTGKGDLISPG